MHFYCEKLLVARNRDQVVLINRVRAEDVKCTKGRRGVKNLARGSTLPTRTLKYCNIKQPKLRYISNE